LSIMWALMDKILSILVSNIFLSEYFLFFPLPLGLETSGVMIFFSV